MFCFFKQKTAYEMRISDWSSDVCSSDLLGPRLRLLSHDILRVVCRCGGLGRRGLGGRGLSGAASVTRLEGDLLEEVDFVGFEAALEVAVGLDAGKAGPVEQGVHVVAAQREQRQVGGVAVRVGGLELAQEIGRESGREKEW